LRPLIGLALVRRHKRPVNLRRMSWPRKSRWSCTRQRTGTVEAALADLDAVEQLHKDEMIGQYDAAVIDKENGKPHVAKRMDRPCIRVIPEWFGRGTLPRKELHEAAEQLTPDQAGLMVVGEPTIEKDSTRR
jgi:hypothetical protein